MIALDTSAIGATALGGPEAELFHALVSREEILVGWPTLLETRMVLTGKNFPNAGAVIAQLVVRSMRSRQLVIRPSSPR